MKEEIEKKNEKKGSKGKHNKYNKPKGNSRPGAKPEKPEPKLDTEYKHEKFSFGNDVSWWTKYPELSDNAANLKDNFVNGTNLVEGSSIGTLRFVNGYSINYITSYGMSQSATSAMNLSFRDIYLKMFRKFRSPQGFQSADVGTAIIGAAEVIRLVCNLERIYGTVNYFKAADQAVPATIARSLGIDWNTLQLIQSNLPNYRFDLNLLIRKITKLCVPKDMSLLANIVSLNSYVYTDHEVSTKAQTIAFVPKYYGIYCEGAATPLKSGSSIAFLDETDRSAANIPMIRSSASDYGNTLFPLLEYMVDQLLSDNVQVIFGNLLTWFGEDQLITLLPLPDDYTLTPVYSESILHKIHNCEYGGYNEFYDNSGGEPAVGTVMTLSEYTDLIRTPGTDDYTINGTTINMFFIPTIFQNNGLLFTRWGVYDNTAGGAISDTIYKGIPIDTNWAGVGTSEKDCLEASYLHPHVLDTYRHDMDIESVIEGSLMKHTMILELGTLSGNTTAWFLYDSTAFEIIHSITGYETVNGQGSIVSSTANTYEYQNTIGQFNIITDVQVLCNMDWAPLTFRVQGRRPNQNIQCMMGDVDHCRLVSNDEINRIHNAVLNSGFKTDMSVKDK